MESSLNLGRATGKAAPVGTRFEGRSRLPKTRRTMMTICTYNAMTLASDASIEDLLMQARKIKYDVIGLTETRRHHPLNATFDTGEELFLGTCDSKGVAV